jgi:hypothetical protein
MVCTDTIRKVKRSKRIGYFVCEDVIVKRTPVFQKFRSKRRLHEFVGVHCCCFFLARYDVLKQLPIPVEKIADRKSKIRLSRNEIHLRM